MKTHPARLMDRQRIDVGAQRDHRLSAANFCHRTGFQWIVKEPDARRLQPAPQSRGGGKLLTRQLRPGVQFTSPFNQL